MTPLLFFYMVVAITIGSLFIIESVYGEQVIQTAEKEYTIDTIEKEYRLCKYCVTKSEGLTTTGERYFLRVSDTFEKVMILDLNGKWHKAQLIEKVTEPTEPTAETIQEPIEVYQPELDIRVQRDFKNYWGQSFDFYILAYDLNINSNPDLYKFEGRLNNADVKAEIFYDGKRITTVYGTTEYGEFHGQYYIVPNLSPGEYNLLVTVAYAEQTVSHSSDMFVIPIYSDSTKPIIP